MSVNKSTKKQRWYLGGLASAGAAACTHPLDLLKVYQTGCKGLFQFFLSLSLALGPFADAAGSREALTLYGSQRGQKSRNTCLIQRAQCITSETGLV